MQQFEPIFFHFIHHRKEQQLDTRICIITSPARILLEGQVSTLTETSHEECFPFLFSSQRSKNYLLTRAVFPLNIWVSNYIRPFF